MSTALLVRANAGALINSDTADIINMIARLLPEYNMKNLYIKYFNYSYFLYINLYLFLIY